MKAEKFKKEAENDKVIPYFFMDFVGSSRRTQLALLWSVWDRSSAKNLVYLALFAKDSLSASFQLSERCAARKQPPLLHPENPTMLLWTSELRSPGLAAAVELCSEPPGLGMERRSSNVGPSRGLGFQGVTSGSTLASLGFGWEGRCGCARSFLASEVGSPTGGPYLPQLGRMGSSFSYLHFGTSY